MIAGMVINHQKFSNTDAFDEIKSQRRKRLKEKKMNTNSISAVYSACISKRMRKGEGPRQQAKRFKFGISFNFKHLLIFIKCFQHTVELEDACNEKALFTTEKRKRGDLQ